MMTVNRTQVSFEDLYFAYECCRSNKKNKIGAKKFEIAATELEKAQITLFSVWGVLSAGKQ